MPIGFQDFWVTGTRFYFQRDAIAGVEQPWADLGILQSAAPQISADKIELFDADGGVQKLADQRTTKISEAFDLTISNLALDNLAFFFLANPPKDFSQTKRGIAMPATAHWARFIKLRDSDSDKTPIYQISIVSGVIKGNAATKSLTPSVTCITASTKTIKIVGNHAAVPELQPGKRFIVSLTGLFNVASAITYTVATITNNGGNTDIVTVETPAQDENNVTGGLIYHAAVDANDKVLTLAQFSTPSLERGLVRVDDYNEFTLTGVVPNPMAVTVVYGTTAYSGRRLLNPQDVSGEIQGTGVLVFGRENNAMQTARETRVALSPSSANFASDAYASIVLSARVLADTTKAVPAGRLLQIKGTTPSLS